MRIVLSAILGVIAAGVMLIAYGVFNPRAATADALNQFARPRQAETVNLPSAAEASVPQLQLRCGFGQRAVIRQFNGATAGECVDDSGMEVPRTARVSMAYPVSDARTIRDVVPVRVYRTAPRRVTTRVERRRRDWGRTAMVIGGSSAAGAGIGALFGGKKGALIGAALAGGAGTLYEVKH